MRGLTADLRFAFRQMLRRPGHSLIAIVTLALGTGASVAVFSVVNGVLLSPLPFPDAGHLVSICETNPLVERFCVASPPDVEDWSQRSRTLASIGLGRDWPFTARRGDRAEGVNGGLATPGLFRTLQVTPALGRLIAPEDVGPGARHVAVLSDRLWRTWYGADPAILGQTVVLDGESYEIVGVLAAGAEVPRLENVRVWVPLPFDPRDEENRKWRGFEVIGRLAPGRTVAAAEAELGAVAHDLGARYPDTNRDWGVRVEPLLDSVVGPVRPTLLVFLGAVGILLLVACANVANLLVARSAAREREFAVRAALGAGRGRLIRLIATESVVLAVVGGAAGIVVARWVLDALLPLLPGRMPRADNVALDTRVLAFAALLTIAAGLLAALGPALRAARYDLFQTLKEGRQPFAWRAALGLRGGLVVAEVALAFVLAIGAGLLTRSFVALLDWQPGFDRQHLLTFWTLASDGTYRDQQSVTALFDRVTAQLKAIPSVTSVGMVSNGPLFGGEETGEFVIDGVDASGTSAAAPIVARWYDMSPGYFPTLGVALKRGRLFTDADRAGAPPVALINEAMARRYFPGTNPVGRRIREKNLGESREIVGVVADIAPFVPGRAPLPEVYWPYAQSPRWASFFVLRTSGDPTALVKAVDAHLHAVDPDLSASNVATMADRVEAQLRRPRFNMLLIGVFAAFAIALTVVGVYGVIAASVAGRAREIGVRVALGATASRVVGMVVREGMVLAAIGLVIGGLVAGLVSRFATSLLYGVRPIDPATYVAVALVLAGVAVLACLLPARRAGRLHPMEALRAE
jgi:putative ABC transport system permease protein